MANCSIPQKRPNSPKIFKNKRRQVTHKDDHMRASNNRFSELDIEDCNNEEGASPILDSSQPELHIHSKCYIPNVTNIKDMTQQFSGIISPTQYSYKALRDGQLRVMVKTIASYRTLVSNAINCHKPFRCVKCGEKHITAECTKSEAIPAKCANCLESNPASYRGCVVHQQFKRKLQNKIYSFANARIKMPFIIADIPQTNVINNNNKGELTGRHLITTRTQNDDDVIEIVKSAAPNDMKPHILYFQTLWEAHDDPGLYYDHLCRSLGITDDPKNARKTAEYHEQMDIIALLGLSDNSVENSFIYYRDNLAISFFPGQINSNSSAGDKPYINQFHLYIYKHTECFNHIKRYEVLRSDRQPIDEQLVANCKYVSNHKCISKVNGGRFFSGLFNGSMIFEYKNRFKVLAFDPCPFARSMNLFQFDELEPLDYVPSKAITVFPKCTINNRSNSNDEPVKLIMTPTSDLEPALNCLSKLRKEHNIRLKFDNLQNGMFLLSGMTIRLDLSNGNLYISFNKIESFVATQTNAALTNKKK